MPTDPGLSCALTVKGFAEDTFRVFRFDGTEAISRLFRFDVWAFSESVDLDLAALLGCQARLVIGLGETRRFVHGMIAELVQEGQTATDEAIYRLVLVPRVADLAASRQSQVYGGENALDIVAILQAELLGQQAKGPTIDAVPRLSEEDVVISIKRGYPARDYVVQYQESDFDFVSRLMEHLGIFYYFDHRGEHETLMISDDNVRCEFLPDGTDTVAYRPTSGLTRPDDLAVTELSCRAKRLPKTLILRDYDYRKPDLDLTVQTSIDPAGHGVVISYGDKVRSTDQARDLAEIRAAELRCRQMEFRGRSTHPGFSAGFVFNLEDHYRDDFNQGYLLLEVRHQGDLWQPQSAAGLNQSADSAWSGYRNHFLAVPAEVTFKPERRTPKPQIGGLLGAVIETELDSDRAGLDADGCYRMRALFDQSGRPRATASKAMRKAEPYAGANRGLHFPVAHGAEVVCGHLGGDPDQPVILGCVANPDNPNVVNDTNQMRCRVRTAAGITLDMNDGTAQTGISSAAEIPQLGAFPSDAGGNGGSGSGCGGDDATFFRLYVPDSAEAGASESYLRLGGADPAVEDGARTPFTERGAAEIEQGYGWFDFTDAGHVSLAKTRCTATLETERHDTVGDQIVAIQGKQRISITGDRNLNVGDTETKSNETSQVTGNRTLEVKGNESLSIGGEQTEDIAIDRSVAIGGADTLKVDGAQNLAVGSRTDTVKGDLTQEVKGDYNLKVTGVLSIEAASITLRTRSGTLTLDGAGAVSLSAGSSLTAESGTTLCLSAGSNLSGKANMNLELSGANQFKASGGISAEVSGGTTAALKGALVQLN